MNTMLNIKTDRRLKSEAQEIAREMGLPLSAVLNSYLREFVSKRKISFAAPFKVNPALKKLLSKVEKDLSKGRHLSPLFTSTEDMDAYLNSL